MEVRLDFGWGNLSNRMRALGGLSVKVGAKWEPSRRVCGDSKESGADTESGLTDCRS